jgi:NADPH2:quinone reductase
MTRVGAVVAADHPGCVSMTQPSAAHPLRPGGLPVAWTTTRMPSRFASTRVPRDHSCSHATAQGGAAISRSSIVVRGRTGRAGQATGMRALAIRPSAPGGPEVLTPSNVEVLPPGPGQVRVKVAFAGVNYLDVYQRTGQYPLPTPIPLGSEGAGVVDAVGDGVDDVREGMRVAWSGIPGSYATAVLAPAEKLVPVPEQVSLEQAAAVMLQGLTAHYLATSTFPLAAGQRCLIHAAAGGVGLLLIQLAATAGAEIFGTVSSDVKAQIAREAGAHHTIRYDQLDFAAEVRAATKGAGVDVVYDSVGRTTFDKSLDALRPRGMMVLFGQSSGPVPPFDLQVLNRKGSLYITRPNLAAYTATRAELLHRAEAVLGAIARGALTVRIEGTVPLVEAATAHKMLESRATSGKLLLRC